MMKYLFTFAALLSFSVLPTFAQDDVPADADETSLTPEELKAQKKAAKDAKKKAMQKKARAKLKFKWFKSLKAALKAAEKNNCTCLVLYSDPAVCPPCRKLDENVFAAREFAKAKGIGVGFRSTEAIEEYKLGQGKPAAVIVDPKGKVIKSMMGYGGQTAEDYIELLKSLQPEIVVPGDKDDGDDD